MSDGFETMRKIVKVNQAVYHIAFSGAR